MCFYSINVIETGSGSNKSMENGVKIGRDLLHDVSLDRLYCFSIAVWFEMLIETQ